MQENQHDAGGKVKIKVADGVTSSAVFSDCGKYRYRLTRRWERLGPLVLFVLQNPSVADENHNDPTVAKCCRYAKRWGYSGVMIGNVCAYRSTDNKQIGRDHFGQVNRDHVIGMATVADMIVFASGKPPRKALSLDYYLFYMSLKLRIQESGQMDKVFYLKRNNDLSFCHPLYLPKDINPTPLYSEQEKMDVSAMMSGVDPETAQVESKEFWDSLSTGGFTIDPGSFFPIPPPNPAMEKICRDYIKNCSMGLDKEV